MRALLLIILAAFVLVRARGRQHRGGQAGAFVRDLGIAAAILLLAVEGSSFALQLAWWRELGQQQTYFQYLRIQWLPQLALALVAVGILIAVFRLARSHARQQLAETRLFGWVGYLIAIAAGWLISFGIIDPWTLALYLGAPKTSTYHDPIFGHSLAFYMFRLPFYQMLYGWLSALSVCALIIYGATLGLSSSIERVRHAQERMREQMSGRPAPIHFSVPSPVSLGGLVRTGGALLLVIYAGSQWLGRYGILYNQHSFLYGADFVDHRFGLPFYWVQVVAALLLAALIVVTSRRRRGREVAENPLWGPIWVPVLLIGGFLVIAIVPSIIEGIVRSLYVAPNELALERPYIVDHIQATRLAYDIGQTSTERAFRPTKADSLDLSQFPATADNIRLWNTAPFLNNITQLQALRPYYVFPSVHADRYTINGERRGVLLSARELDPSKLSQNAQTWVNLHLQYTHGYGAVAALVNGATDEGQPELFLKNAPPETTLPRFNITRPEIYFGESTVQPVFVDTSQPEFNYPSGDENAYNKYHGTAGIHVGGWGMRLAAALARDESNILLSHYFTPSTRLLLHRQIMDRVARLAPFLTLDPNPYPVINSSGHMFWMIDAYTSSDRHPYAEPIDFVPADATGYQPQVNYIRNSVKITVDAYNGTVHFYVFDSRDPLIQAYRNVFPNLFLPRSAMPADLLRHIRYPRQIFQAQADIYRTYHMTDPQVFYNKEDMWDVTKQVSTQEQTQLTRPYYVMTQLPQDGGISKQAEFVLMQTFASHNRDNLIAWVAARCDPKHYGQILFYRLPKEQLVYGPLQIASRIDQDPVISKDLSLWNQQGSRVIRGSTLVLPVNGTFLYAEPIYIQATQAHLPELKKVVLAMGDRLIYRDSLPEAIADLAQPAGSAPSAAPPYNAGAPAGPAGKPGKNAAPGAQGTVPVAVLQSIQNHMERYRQLTAQGQMGAAGAELQAAEDELRRALQGR